MSERRVTDVVEGAAPRALRWDEASPEMRQHLVDIVRMQQIISPASDLHMGEITNPSMAHISVTPILQWDAVTAWTILFSLDPYDAFGLTYRAPSPDAAGITLTQYLDGTWSGCPPVPDDSIHAAELSITPARHRLEHDLWHHLVGIWAYRSLGSPIIWRDAHHVPQPVGELRVTERVEIDTPEAKVSTCQIYQDLFRWGPTEEEEWLVTALSHRLHGDMSRDHGASIWLRDNGHDADAMITQARGILSQIPM